MSHEEMADFRAACNFTMGTYQCILGKIYELRQKVCFKIQDLVLPRGLPSLESKHKFLNKKWRKRSTKAWVRQTTDEFFLGTANVDIFD